MRMWMTPSRLRVRTSDAALRGLTGRCDMLLPMTCCHRLKHAQWREANFTPRPPLGGRGDGGEGGRSTSQMLVVLAPDCVAEVRGKLVIVSPSLSLAELPPSPPAPLPPR